MYNNTPHTKLESMQMAIRKLCFSNICCCDWNWTKLGRNSSLRTVWSTPSKLPATHSWIGLPQSVKQRCRVIPWKAHPTGEGRCVTVARIEVASCSTAYLCTHWSPTQNHQQNLSHDECAERDTQICNIETTKTLYFPK